MRLGGGLALAALLAWGPALAQPQAILQKEKPKPAPKQAEAKKSEPKAQKSVTASPVHRPAHKDPDYRPRKEHRPHKEHRPSEARTAPPDYKPPSSQVRAAPVVPTTPPSKAERPSSQARRRSEMWIMNSMSLLLSAPAARPGGGAG